MIKKYLVILGLVGALAACGGREQISRTQLCPYINKVVDAQELIRFGGSGGRDLTDIDFIASFDSIVATCEIDDGYIEAEIEIITSAQRGPANQNRTATYSYFIAIADWNDRILTRESFPVTVEFEGNRTRVGQRDTVYPRIPLKLEETGADYRLYYGLEVSASELEYNRQNR